MAKNFDDNTTSRYTDLPDVTIDANRIPQDLRNLIEYAKYWCIGDDVQRSELMSATPPNQLQALVDSVWPKMGVIKDWCRSHDGDVPVPDEVVVFDMLAQAVAEAAACHVEPSEDHQTDS